MLISNAYLLIFALAFMGCVLATPAGDPDRASGPGRSTGPTSSGGSTRGRPPGWAAWAWRSGMRRRASLLVGDWRATSTAGRGLGRLVATAVVGPRGRR